MRTIIVTLYLVRGCGKEPHSYDESNNGSATLSFEAYTWPYTMDTSRADLVREFFEPALSRSVRYDRAVGYFSSGWLRIAAGGCCGSLPTVVAAGG